MGYSGPNGWFHCGNDKIVICKINPKDVVCVPHDMSQQKIRVCEYTVVGDFQGELNRTCYSGEVNDDYSPKEVCDDREDYFEDDDEMLVDEWYTFKHNGNRVYVVITENGDSFIKGRGIGPDEHLGDRIFHKTWISDVEWFDLDQWYEDRYEEELEEDDDDDDYYAKNWP